MANSRFGDYYSISQGREIDLSPNETKGIFYNLYYKFSSVLGGYYLSNRGNNLYITHPWVYFVCQFHREGSEFYTPSWFSLSCQVEKDNNNYTIDIFNEKAHGKYIGYNYEGDTALIAFRIDAAHFKGVDKIISFTPTISGVGGNRSQTYIISEQSLLKSLHWNDNNLKSITYTSDIDKTQVLIQDWYDAYNVGLSSYYKNGTKTYKYYNQNFYFFFNQARYLSSSNITPNKANFYYLDNGEQKVLTTELTSSTLNSRNILIEDVGKQVNFNKISVTFISKAKNSSGTEVPLEKEIPIEEDLSFKHYSYAFNDLQGANTNVFQLKNPVNIKRNKVTLLSKIAYTIQIPEDFPYDFTDAILAFNNSNGDTVVEAVTTKDKIKIDKTEAVIITSPSTGAEIKIDVIYSNGSDNETNSIFSNGAHTLEGNILNRFTGKKDNEAIFSITPTFNKQYILIDGVNYQIQALSTTQNGVQVVDIPGRVLLSGEYININQTTDIKQWIINTETLALINNCNSINFSSDCKMKSSQDLYDLGESIDIITATNSTDDTLKYNYDTLNSNFEDKNLTYFISLEPVLSASLDNGDNDDEIITVKTYNELFTIGRLTTPVVDKSFIPKFEGNILKYSLTEYGGDKNDYYGSDFFINARLDTQPKYFSLARTSNSTANEKLKIEFFEKDGDSYKDSPSKSCTATITTTTALEQILSSFRENMIGELDLSVIMNDTPWTSLIGKTVKIKVSYYYEKDNYRKDLIAFELLNISMQSGSRSLGLRKNGIIIAPVEQKEDLPPGTAQRINLKTQLSSDNAKRNGTALEVRVCDAAGTPLKNGEEEITCTIEYRNDNASNNGAGAFYFDGVNVSELKNTVGNSSAGLVKKVGDLETKVGDSDSGLVKDVNQNTTNISSLKELQIFECEDITDNEFSDGDVYSGTFTFSNDDILTTSFCIPTIYGIFQSGNDTAALKRINPTLSGFSKTEGQCTVSWRTETQNNTAGYHYKYKIGAKLLVINLPSILTSSVSFNSLSTDSSGEVIDIIETDTEENQNEI